MNFQHKDKYINFEKTVGGHCQIVAERWEGQSPDEFIHLLKVGCGGL